MMSAAVGFQNDGAGELWCAVANTAHGRIPGKAKDGTCWYSYGGKEEITEDFQIIHASGTAPGPQGPPHGQQNDGPGGYWCAVADTPHGKIPGKAQGGSCWYAYGGEEHFVTENFQYIVSMGLGVQVPGFQNDGAGKLWCAVANTEHGKIPGKAKDGTCWYSFGGKEEITEDFQIIHVSGFAPEPHGPPHGQQRDSGDYWCAVADTPHGKIPGKAQGGSCWYAYGGEEHFVTANFQYIVGMGLGAQVPGFQNDGAGHLWCAVANTEHGRIPGKAKDGTCWYSYGGEEKTTEEFQIVDVCGLADEPHGPPHGQQNDGSGEYWCAVADSEHGHIPGKAKGSECWYAYGGKEHHVTSNFKFAVTHP